MVDMEAPAIAPHQATVKITFSAARHPTTDPSKYGIALYSYDGVRLQSQYTTIKQVGLYNFAFDFLKFHKSDATSDSVMESDFTAMSHSNPSLDSV